MDLDPFSAGFLRDPWPGLAELREAGVGIHLCVGAAFARMEGEAILGALARQVGSIEPNGAPVPRLNNTLSGFTELPLVLRP